LSNVPLPDQMAACNFDYVLGILRFSDSHFFEGQVHLQFTMVESRGGHFN